MKKFTYLVLFCTFFAGQSYGMMPQGFVRDLPVVVCAMQSSYITEPPAAYEYFKLATGTSDYTVADVIVRRGIEELFTQTSAGATPLHMAIERSNIVVASHFIAALQSRDRIIRACSIKDQTESVIFKTTIKELFKAVKGNNGTLTIQLIDFAYRILPYTDEESIRNTCTMRNDNKAVALHVILKKLLATITSDRDTDNIKLRDALVAFACKIIPYSNCSLQDKYSISAFEYYKRNLKPLCQDTILEQLKTAMKASSKSHFDAIKTENANSLRMEKETRSLKAASVAADTINLTAQAFGKLSIKSEAQAVSDTSFSKKLTQTRIRASTNTATSKAIDQDQGINTLKITVDTDFIKSPAGIKTQVLMPNHDGITEVSTHSKISQRTNTSQSAAIAIEQQPIRLLFTKLFKLIAMPTQEEESPKKKSKSKKKLSPAKKKKAGLANTLMTARQKIKFLKTLLDELKHQKASEGISTHLWISTDGETPLKKALDSRWFDGAKKIAAAFPELMSIPCINGDRVIHYFSCCNFMAEEEGLTLADYDCDIWALLIHWRHHDIAAAFFGEYRYFRAEEMAYLEEEFGDQFLPDEDLENDKYSDEDAEEDKYDGVNHDSDNDSDNN